MITLPPSSPMLTQIRFTGRFIDSAMGLTTAGIDWFALLAEITSSSCDSGILDRSHSRNRYHGYLLPYRTLYVSLFLSDALRCVQWNMKEFTCWLATGRVIFALGLIVLTLVAILDENPLFTFWLSELESRQSPRNTFHKTNDHRHWVYHPFLDLLNANQLHHVWIARYSSMFGYQRGVNKPNICQ